MASELCFPEDEYQEKDKSPSFPEGAHEVIRLDLSSSDDSQSPSDSSLLDMDPDTLLQLREPEIDESSIDDEHPTQEAERERYRNFLFAPAVSTEEVAATSETIKSDLDTILKKVEQGGRKAYLDYQEELKRMNEESTENETEKKQAIEDALIHGTPRDYQTKLFEIAKTQNTIINLGTGKGKTLIALMCIRHYSEELSDGKQTLFVVPSVPLALQQTNTLKANLPFSVGTACLAVSHSGSSRKKLSESQIVVATHGAIHDLLMHYGDIFQMSKFNLVVFDECHYASGNHHYSTIMKKWYHTLPENERPRILGLTASPLVSVKHTHSDERLQSMLESLEAILDATVASLKDLGVDDNSLLHKPAAESHV